MVRRRGVLAILTWHLRDQLSKRSSDLSEGRHRCVSESTLPLVTFNDFVSNVPVITHSQLV